MTLTFSELFAPTQVDNAAPETLITVPASPATSLLRNGRIRFANTTVLAATIKAWAVPTAGSPADGNVCLPTTSVAAMGYIDIDVPFIKAGGTLQAQSGTVSSITATYLDGFIQS